MKLYRFMGPKELWQYIWSFNQNSVDWRQYGNCSDSKGFCFFDDKVLPEERIPYLTGIVDMQLCVEFETIGPIRFKKSMGRYRDPKRDRLNGPIKMMFVPEYSTTRYSKQTLRLIRYGHVDPLKRRIEWKYL